MKKVRFFMTINTSTSRGSPYQEPTPRKHSKSLPITRKDLSKVTEEITKQAKAFPLESKAKGKIIKYKAEFELSPSIKAYSSPDAPRSKGQMIQEITEAANDLHANSMDLFTRVSS